MNQVSYTRALSRICAVDLRKKSRDIANAWVNERDNKAAVRVARGRETPDANF